MTRTSDGHSESASRIAPRYHFETRVAIKMKSGTTTEGWVRDLSESGIGAFVGRELTVGETGTLTFRLTDSIKLVVPAQVTASVGTRYGFRFLALSAEQRDQISKATQHLKMIPFVGS
jgi:c-di-GMP-binding flagellar brake protein YcgR